jgi:hypothetical protein
MAKAMWRFLKGTMTVPSDGVMTLWPLLPPQWKPFSFGCFCDGGTEGLKATHHSLVISRQIK